MAVLVEGEHPDYRIVGTSSMAERFAIRRTVDSQITRQGTVSMTRDLKFRVTEAGMFEVVYISPRNSVELVRTL